MKRLFKFILLFVLGLFVALLAIPKVKGFGNITYEHIITTVGEDQQHQFVLTGIQKSYILI